MGKTDKIAAAVVLAKRDQLLAQRRPPNANEKALGIDGPVPVYTAAEVTRLLIDLVGTLADEASELRALAAKVSEESTPTAVSKRAAAARAFAASTIDSPTLGPVLNGGESPGLERLIKAQTAQQEVDRLRDVVAAARRAATVASRPGQHLFEGDVAKAEAAKLAVTAAEGELRKAQETLEKLQAPHSTASASSFENGDLSHLPPGAAEAIQKARERIEDRRVMSGLPPERPLSDEPLSDELSKLKLSKRMRKFLGRKARK